MSLPAATAAYVSGTREVRIIDDTGRDRPLSSPGAGMVWGAWGQAPPRPESFSWPTWSPDGRQIACFRLPAEEGGAAAVVAMGADGVSSIELAELGGRLPIYLYWSPDGQRVALLTQQDEQLRLSTVAVGEPGVERELLTGSPLFFTWAGAGSLAAFVGSPSGAPPRLAVLDPAGEAPARSLPGVPGNFCAPLWLRDKVVYVLHQGGSTRVVSAAMGAQLPHPIEDVDGLVAMVAAPDGHTVARAIAPAGDGTPYRRIALVDVATDEVRDVLDVSCLAYLWSPKGDALLVARVDTERNLLEWLRVSLDGRTDHLVDMYPTRDLGFYLRFFEQYTQSHPLVDPTGQSLLVAGTLVGKGPGRGSPRVWRVDIATGATEDVGEGVFAVYAPG